MRSLKRLIEHFSVSEESDESRLPIHDIDKDKRKDNREYENNKIEE